MAHEQSPLPYTFDALEPHIDARTMEIHYGKHHATYVSKLNDALEGTDVGELSIGALLGDLSVVPEAKRTAVRNNGGGHANHTLFWDILSSEGGGSPSGALADAISNDLAGLDAFKESFANAATTRFGSGWAWLCVGGDGKLFVCSTPNQDNPSMAGVAESSGQPILGLDVWEHAYYLNYQNRRPDYITAFWNVVNWSRVAERYHEAT